MLSKHKAKELRTQENMLIAMAVQDEMQRKEVAREFDVLKLDANICANATQAAAQIREFRHITQHEHVELKRQGEYAEVRKELDQATTRCSQMAMAGIYAAT